MAISAARWKTASEPSMRSWTQAGSVTDIAPGETIYSVRFVGDRAYMVTFKTVDPFFVLDLEDPRNPRILGKLKIPGFSNYLLRVLWQPCRWLPVPDATHYRKWGRHSCLPGATQHTEDAMRRT